MLNQDYSNFWKLNINGFTGKKNEKEGFLVGPTILHKNNEDEYDQEFYEIFSPQVWIYDDWSKYKKKQFRILVFKAEKITYVMFLNEDKFKMTMDKYSKLEQELKAKAVNMEK